MKKIIFTLLATIICITIIHAQSPNKFKYQTVVRDNSGNIIQNHPIAFKISLLQGSNTGTVSYCETQSVSTNDFGLANLEIGNGIIISGSINTINWANGPYFVKIELDIANGTNFIIMGTSQLLTVPYAMYAEKTSATGYTETDPAFGVSPAHSITTNDINNWNTTFGWGNHAGLYKLISWIPSWSDIINKPTTIAGYGITDAFDGTYGSLIGKPALWDSTWATIKNKPNLATVATTGSYNDLSNKPGVTVGANIGDMQYWNGTTWVILPVGQNGQYLQINSSNIPAWSGAIFPTINTTSVSLITNTTAICGGNITNDGGAIITARGVCWSTTVNPTIAILTKTNDGAGAGTFTSLITGLIANTTYYMRAYASNSAGTAYGNQVSFTTLQNNNIISMTDYDGNIYDSIRIGNQTWLKQNLKTTHYRNGDFIPNVTDTTSWSNLTTGAYCDYNNIPSNSTTYGRLYNWYTVNDTRNICPVGWHVPSDSEWTILETYLGGWTIAGGKLKEVGTSHWQSPNAGATNETGFTALPGGFRNINGTGTNWIYNYIGNSGFLWSSTESTTTLASRKYLYYNQSGLSNNSNNKKYGFSVRCIKD